MTVHIFVFEKKKWFHYSTSFGRWKYYWMIFDIIDVRSIFLYVQYSAKERRNNLSVLRSDWLTLFEALIFVLIILKANRCWVITRYMPYKLSQESFLHNLDSLQFNNLIHSNDKQKSENGGLSLWNKRCQTLPSLNHDLFFCLAFSNCVWNY